jgi:hypothetical protein
MINAALIILVPYIMEKRDLGKKALMDSKVFLLSFTAVGSAASSQFRILGGLVGIAIVVSVSTPYIRSRLTNIVSHEMALLLLEKTEAIALLEPDDAANVKSLFGKGYNLQVRILIGFAVAKLPVTALMWTNVRSET